MFDASLGEFFVCGVVGLVVLGPEKFIHTVTVTTKIIGQMKTAVMTSVDELTQAAQLTEMQEEFNKLQAEIQQHTTSPSAPNPIVEGSSSLLPPPR